MRLSYLRRASGWGTEAALFAAVVLCPFVASCGRSPSTPTASTSNTAPTVAVVFPGASSCSPGAGAPCSVEVLAQASDPDGDALQYAWSGCAAGASARATCTISAFGPATASVSVGDGHGHTVSASATAQGVAVPNAPPRVSVAFEAASACTLVASKPCVIDAIATAIDPDGDALTYRWSGCASGTGPKAPCTIDHVGPAVASVEVGDDHGHTVSAEATGTGLQDSNRPPEVRVSFDGPSQCTPLPVKPLTSGGPCTLTVAAQASDPDGDPLRYNWSGCATGHASRATCTVSQPGSVDAIVEVDDDRGHRATGTAAALGLNQPPGLQIGYVVLLPTSSNTIDLLGNVIDPDEGFLCGRQYCVSAVASGACRSAFLECTCLAGLEAEVTRTAPTGTCTVTFSLKDTWGQIGTPAYSFDVGKVSTSGVTIKKH